MSDTEAPPFWSPESPLPSPLSPDGWIAFYQVKPGAAAPGVEVTNRTGGDPPRAAAAWAVALLSASVGTDDAALDVAIVVPEETALESVLHHVKAFDGDVTHLSVIVLAPPNLDALADAIRDRQSPAAVCVVDADRYDDPTPPSHETKDADEDLEWAESAARVAGALDEQIPDEGGPIILLLADHPPPFEAAGLAPLIHSGVGVTIEGLPGVDAQSRNWVERLRLGDDSPLDEIEASESDPYMRAWTTARVLLGSRRPAQAFPHLQPHLDRLVAEAAPPALAAAAMAAVHAEELGEAKRLLHAALAAEPDDLWTLRVVLNLSRDLDDENITLHARDRLVHLYPTSDTALRERVEMATTTDDFREILNDLHASEPTSDMACYIRDLSAHLADPDLDIPSAVADLMAHWPDQNPTRAVAQTLFDRANLAGARAALLAGPRIPANTGDALMWLDAVEASFLNEVPDGDLAEPTIEFVQTAVEVVSGYLLRTPSDARVRNAFYDTIKPDTSGGWGTSIVATAAHHALDLVPPPLSPAPELADIPDDDLLDIMRRTFEQSARESDGEFFIGKGTPADPAPYTHRQVLDGLWDLIRGFDEQDPDHFGTFEYTSLLHVALLHASATDAPGARAQLMERMAGVLWRAGNAQGARNLAEQALSDVPDEIVEQITAWTAFAEIYLIGQRPHEAVIGLSVIATAGRAPVPPRVAYHVAYLAARLFRNLRLFDLVPDAIARARRLADKADIANRVHERLRAVGFGAAIGLALSKGTAGRESLEELATNGLKFIQYAIEHGEETLPIVSPLVSAIPLLSDATASAVRSAARAAADAASGTAKAYLSVIADPPRCTEDLVHLFGSLAETYHAEDAGTDLTLSAFVARMGLDRDDLAPLDRLAIQDWLANHAVRPPDVEPWDGGRFVRIDPRTSEDDDQPARRLGPRSTDDVRATVAALADEGIEVLSYARLNGGRGPLSVVVSRADGTVEQVPAPAFDVEAYLRWAETYPYGYGEKRGERHDLNEYEYSLRGLTLPTSGGDAPIVIVPEVDLQRLPPNLPMVDGLDRPAMIGTIRPVAAAPSLAWLHGTIKTPHGTSGRRLAWIPIPTAHGSFTRTPLEALEHHIREVDSIDLVTDSVPPDGLAGADLAVIGAHGDVDPHGKRFLRGADEESQRFTASALASLARGSLVTVLFVCSGGRLDPHPFSPTTLGLPSAFLNAGCRAVIASPWPLDPAVARRWMPAFVEACDEGTRVIEAVYVANEAVRNNAPAAPDHFLAMNLYGDPTVTLA